eukprot:Gb_24202 [translate_table: standard]
MVLHGEAVVVALVIIRVLFSVPSVLLWEGLGLVGLGVAGLLVELASDDDAHKFKFNSLKPRPGSSSGIFLGTVTLPTVMLSRLIQLCRSISEQESEIPDSGNLRLQFWAACACSLGVLFFLLCILCNASKGGLYHLPTQKMRFWMISMSFTISFGTVCSFSLMTMTQLGYLVSLAMGWLLLHALVSGTVLQYIIHTFPCCASIGEALLVTGGLVLYLADALAYTLAKANMHVPLLNHFFGGVNEKRDKISTIIQALFVGLLLMSKFYKVILYIWKYLTSVTKIQVLNSKERASEDFQKSIVFCAALGITLTIIAPRWLYFVQDFQTHPLLWIINFILQKPLERLALCIYWLAVICLGVLRFYDISKNSTIERILLRKYYHLMAVIMFVPALLFQPEFLNLAFGAALATFLVLEMVRVWRILPLGDLVHQFMNAFTDHRDSEILIISHFSLLLGCAIPIWMCGHLNDRPLAPFAGILSLGIGDTMASMVGHKYGVLRWSKSGKKTVEGTAAGITSVLLACSVLLPWVASTSFILSQHWLSLVLSVICAGLLEAYTTQLDNAFIPLIFYSLLCL